MTEEVKKELTPEQLQSIFAASIQLMDQAVKDILTAWTGIKLVLLHSQPQEETDADSPTDPTQS
jgi:hypothetical protein